MRFLKREAFPSAAPVVEPPQRFIEIYNKRKWGIDIAYIKGLLNQIGLNTRPHPSSNNEQRISRYFHKPHTPPSSAMLMEKRLIFCIIKTKEQSYDTIRLL